MNDARNPDRRHSFAALKRAARMAREIAIRTDTAIIIRRDGQMVRVTRDALKREAAIEA